MSKKESGVSASSDKEKPDARGNSKIAKTPNLKSDGLFKSVFGTQLAAREFLEEYLPDSFKEIVDLSKVEVDKESYVEEDLQRRLSDVVYRVGVKGKGGKGRVGYGKDAAEKDRVEHAFIYCLIEHTSSNDHLMAFRVWKYVLLMLDRYIEDNKIDGKTSVKLPLVFPLVVYGGKGKYRAAKNLWELFREADMARDALGGDYALVDLQSMSDDDIKKDQHIAIVQYMMKHIRDRDLVKVWDNMFKLFPDAVLLDREKGYVYVKKLLWYSVDKLEGKNNEEGLKKVLESNLKKEGTEVMRSIADKWTEEAVEKNTMVITQNLLQSNVDYDVITKATGLSIDQINKLKNKL